MLRMVRHDMRHEYMTWHAGLLRLGGVLSSLDFSQFFVVCQMNLIASATSELVTCLRHDITHWQVTAAVVWQVYNSCFK
jgi:hypothetical protein